MDSDSRHLLRAKAKVKPKIHHVCKQSIEQGKNCVKIENHNAASRMASSSPSMGVMSDYDCNEMNSSDKKKGGQPDGFSSSPGVGQNATRRGSQRVRECS